MHSAPLFGVSRSTIGAYDMMQYGSTHALAPQKKLPAQSSDFPGMPTILITGDEAFSFNAKGPDTGKLMLKFFSRH